MCTTYDLFQNLMKDKKFVAYLDEVEMFFWGSQ